MSRSRLLCLSDASGGSSPSLTSDVGRRGQAAIQDSREAYEESHDLYDITAGLGDHVQPDHYAEAGGRSPRVVGGSATRDGSVQSHRQDRDQTGFVAD